ncbi:YbaB/EbfC family nucleoid-associated protein [Microtetraspora sp. AC03309]|uniref:YbaB/EbfC family nucleoid-associated protein n=1 Tax=Microtetraspora sp. AC03309 TaxID=2779376 RepID=UPI001E563325|nr:YbaB/EbfC family nucleoid-associated protein [Microtetraspora sp. AC03309]MCC5577135.1 YbaB/EbfC family nucleoid-associated protein [Microtetraspora sp. AC03309]
MSDEYQAMIEGLAREYNMQAARLRETYGSLNELTATSRSEDGMVTVTIGSRGQVRNIQFDPRVYRKLSPSELSHSIMELIGKGTAEIAERTQELMAPLLPEGLSYEELFGDGVDFASFLPQPIDLPPKGEV